MALTSAQVKAGYSTIPGPYDPVSGKLSAPANSPVASGTNSQGSPIASSSQAVPTGKYVSHVGLPGSSSSGMNQAQADAYAQQTPGTVPPVANPNATQPNPATTQAGTSLPGNPNTGNIKLTPQQQALYDNAVKNAQPNAFQQGLANAKASGTPPPKAGGASAATTPFMPPDATPPQVPPPVQNFLDPAVNKPLGEQVQALMDIVSPPQIRQNLADEMAKITDEKNTLAQDKLQLMNVKNVMSGTEQDIRDEVTKANGFATDSQVLALTVARNSTLLKQATFLQDQLNMQQDLINNDTALLASDKADAASQLTERMGLMNYIQTNQQNIQNAARQSIDTLIKTPGGLDAYSKDPTQAARAEQIMGFAPGTIASMAKQAIVQQNLDNAVKQSTIDKNRSGIAADNANALAPYLKSDYNGNNYVDLSSLTGAQKNQFAQLASKQGLVSILTPGDSGKINAISDTKTNLQNISDSINSILNNNNPTSQGISNTIKGAFGNADIGSFKAYRTAIINSVQALAGGTGSGLRINKAEIDSAMQNDLPVITGIHADNLATAQAKLAKLNTQLDNWSKQLLGGGNKSGAKGEVSGSDTVHIPPIGTVLQKGGKSYHVIDNQGNIQPI